MVKVTLDWVHTVRQPNKNRHVSKEAIGHSLVDAAGIAFAMEPRGLICSRHAIDVGHHGVVQSASRIARRRTFARFVEQEQLRVPNYSTISNSSSSMVEGPSPSIASIT